jgi:hypothetical protein
MSWNILIKETKKETKYKIWSTVSDSFITNKWMNKKEIINFLFWHRFRDFIDNFVEDAMTFPNGWSQKDGKRIMIDGRSDEFYKFRTESIKNDTLAYEKFIEELSKQGIKMSVEDSKYKFNNL